MVLQIPIIFLERGTTMKQWRSFILGMITTMLLISLADIATASTGEKNAVLTYKNIRITLDGVEVVPKDANGNVVEPFIVDGTTYLPIRGIANALGLSVSWIDETSTVALTKSSLVTPGSSTGTQNNTNENGVSYKITYQNSKLYEDSHGKTYCYAIVEVNNTGSSNLYLKDAIFDFEDQNGNLLATYSSLISSDPNIIAPGEKGYFYCNMAALSGNINSNTDYIFKPTLQIEKSKNDIIRYEISNLSMTEGEFLSPVKIIGRVTNNTNKDDSMVWVSCVLYRADGTPIAVHGTNVLGLKAGQTLSFDANAVYLMSLGLDYSEIASYKVYACKTQYQF